MFRTSKSNDVILVTNDKAFFKNRNYKDGLAENLLIEAQSLPYTISIFSELVDLLEEIRSDLTLQDDQLIKLIEKETYNNVLKISERNGFDIEKLSNRKFDIFATTNPKEVSIKFSLKYDLQNRTEEHRFSAYTESRGEFLLNIENYNIRDFVNHGEYVCFMNEDGEVKETKNIYERGEIVIGHKTIEHQIVYKLGER